MTATAQTKGEFWSEKFDADLYKVLPEVRQLLESFDAIPIYTVGHTTNGRLDHPSCWNSDGCCVSYFGFRAQPQEFVPRHYYYGNAQVIECTFAEAIRDAWVHNNTGAFWRGDGWQTLFKAERIYWAFYQLMCEVRGLNKAEGWNRTERGIWKARHAATRWVVKAAVEFELVSFHQSMQQD